MPFRGFFSRRRNPNPSPTTTTPPTNVAASSSRGNRFLRFHRENLLHRNAIVSPSQEHLTPTARRRQPNLWLLEVSHLIQMLDMTVSRLSAPPLALASASPRRRRLSVASVTIALNGLSVRRSSHPAEPERSIVTEIYADIEAILLYRVDEIELSRVSYFLERLVVARDQLAELAACEFVEAVDRVIARMREWVSVGEVAGRGAGAVIFGGK